MSLVARGPHLAALLVLGSLLAWAAWLLSRDPCVGVADNLDYWRVGRPAGIDVRPPEEPGGYVVCTYPLATGDLGRLPSAPAAIAWLVRHLAGSREFDLRSLGLAYLFASVVLVVVALAAGRPTAAVLGAVWVAVDPGFLLFYNSLYADPCLILGLLGVVLFLPATAIASTGSTPRARWATWALIPCAAVAGLSKMQYSSFPTVLLLICIVALALRRRRPGFGELAFCAALAGLAVGAWWHFARGSGPRFIAANDYDAVFSGIAVLAHEPAVALDRLGVPAQARSLAGGTYFDADPGERAVAAESLRALSRWRLGWLYARDPEAVLRAARRAARELWKTGTNPRGNYTREESGGDPRMYRVPFQFALWRTRLLGWLPAWTVWVFLGALAVWLLVAAWRPAWTAVDSLTLLLLLWVPGQSAVAILGDGLVSLHQHLLGARLALDLLIVLTAIRGLEAVARMRPWRRWTRRPGAGGPSARLGATTCG